MKFRLYAATMPLFVLILLSAQTVMAIDPCTFITQADAAAILGEAVKAPKQGQTTGFAVGNSCTYHTAAPLSQRGGVGSLYLIVYDSETMQQKNSMFTAPAEYYKRMRNANQSAANDRNKDLEGLGEQSYWQAGVDQLHLIAGDLYFVLSIKDLAKITSDKGRDDLNAKISAHRLAKCKEAALTYLLPKLK
jgi:hypothetical protein